MFDTKRPHFRYDFICTLQSLTGTMSNLPAQFILTQHFGIQQEVITKTLLAAANHLLSTPVSLFCIKHLFLIITVQRQPSHSTTNVTLSLSFKGIRIVLKSDTLNAGWPDRIPPDQLVCLSLNGECTCRHSQARWLRVFYFEEPPMPKKIKRLPVWPLINTLNA